MVALQRLTEQVADQTHHLFMITEMLRFIQWHIIFVDQQDRLLPIMLMKELTEGQKAGYQYFLGHAEPLSIGRVDRDQLFIGCFFPGGQHIAVQQKLKAHGFPSDDGTEHPQGRLVVSAAHIL